MSSHWATEEMKGAKLPDGRYRKNLASICASLAARTGVAFSVACGTRLRQSAHRLFEDPKTTPAGLLAGHADQTVERSRGFEIVLVAQDTTALDYTSHPAMTGLGPMGTKKQGQGVWMHTALALTVEGRALGVLYQSVWARSQEAVAPRRERPPEQKESHKWTLGLEAVNAAFAPKKRSRSGTDAAPSVDPSPQVIVIQDREADVFSFLAAPRGETIEVLVRVGQEARKVLPVITDRRRVEQEASPFPQAIPTIRTEGSDETLDGVGECARSAPRIGSRIVTLPRKPGLPERTVRLGLQRAVVVVEPPRNGTADASVGSKRYELIRAVELTSLEGNDWEEAPNGVEWMLYTTLVPDADESSEAFAARVVGYYAQRWGVERFHFTLKSGLRVERLQIDDATSLANALAVCSVVAWRLLSLTHQAREEPNSPPEREFSDIELVLLRHSAKGPVVNLRDAVRAVARLGGFEGTPSAGEPGVKVLWQGLSRLSALVQGYLFALSPSTL